MQVWQMLLIIGVIFLIIEMLTPVLFFLNLALAAFVTAAASLYTHDTNILITYFVGFSLIFLIFLRPFLLRTRENGKKTGVEEKYFGQIARVEQTVTASNGVVTIYGERWSARSITGEEIPVGEDVRIVRNESLILFVEREK